MTMEIKTKKILLNRKAGREILGFKDVLTEDELPEEYIDEYPHIYIDECGDLDIFNIGEYYTMTVGMKVLECNFQKMLKLVKLSGNNLHKIYKKYPDADNTWSGKETFKI